MPPRNRRSLAHLLDEDTEMRLVLGPLDSDRDAWERFRAEVMELNTAFTRPASYWKWDVDPDERPAPGDEVGYLKDHDLLTDEEKALWPSWYGANTDVLGDTDD